MARFYGMDAEAVGNLTLKQFNGYLDNLEYVMHPESKEFGKPPNVTLPELPITRYAVRCGITIPFDVHKDLIQNGDV